VIGILKICKSINFFICRRRKGKWQSHEKCFL